MSLLPCPYTFRFPLPHEHPYLPSLYIYPLLPTPPPTQLISLIYATTTLPAHLVTHLKSLPNTPIAAVYAGATTKTLVLEVDNTTTSTELYELLTTKYPTLSSIYTSSTTSTPIPQSLTESRPLKYSLLLPYSYGVDNSKRYPTTVRVIPRLVSADKVKNGVKPGCEESGYVCVTGLGGRHVGQVWRVVGEVWGEEVGGGDRPR